MTITRSSNAWFGLSTDLKPGMAGGLTGIPSTGDTFKETDTGKSWVWTGSVWNAQAAISASATDTLGNTLTYTQTAAGFQMPTSPTANVYLMDNFNGTTIDTVYRWASPVLAGSGTMTQAGTNLVTTLGTTASNGAAISSLEAFEPNIGGLTAGTLLQCEALPATNTNRCFGFYTRPGSFTAATPVQDGYVWEIDIAGTFGASIYNAGTRVFRQTFPMPTSTFVPLSISYQGLNAFFFYGNFQTPSVIVPLIQPSTSNLPFGFHSINHTTPPAIAPLWQLGAIAVADGSGILEAQWNGQVFSRIRSPGVFKALNAVAIASEATIWTPAAGRKFRLMGGCLTGGVATGNVVLKDNTAGASLPIILPFGIIGQNIPFVVGGNGYISTAANNVLTATGSSTQTLSGWIYGTEE
jgi:hypothetical protein